MEHDLRWACFCLTKRPNIRDCPKKMSGNQSTNLAVGAASKGVDKSSAWRLPSFFPLTRDMMKHVVILVSLLMVFVTAFPSFVCQNQVRRKDSSFWRARFHHGRLWNAAAEQDAYYSSPNIEDDSSKTTQTLATVVRLAARTYTANGSKPSSRNYTTRKDSRESITVTRHGVENDYNHYRTVALKSTRDRAISILTTDVMTALQTKFPSCQLGDLGENILLEGMAFSELQIGKQYTFGEVVVEVTEPMIPCANLCKLSYINDEELTPKERVSKCLALLEFLEHPGDGFRGWYAKVISGGVIHVGDEVRAIHG